MNATLNAELKPDLNVGLVERAVEAGRLRHAALSREVRRAHGIVHTPAQVARWALAQVDACLRAQLGCALGLSDSRVALLDPALGTGTWLAAALERMSPLHPPSVGPQLFGFDIDGAAITAANELLGQSAQHAHATLSLHHANMLNLADPWGPSLRDRVRVIVGNPPWSARSQSRGLTLSDKWLAEFRSDGEGVSLGERRSGVLSDDYVRFFRWALEQARTSHAGTILCLATNSSYLDGPVHRGMREALVNAFDYIEILDLGGNALRGTDGTRDENVFGVRVGTCLTLAVRKADHQPDHQPDQKIAEPAARQARICYAKLTGTSASKLERLTHRAGDVLPAAQVFASRPFFRFIPALPGYDRKGSEQPTFSLAEAFPFHREGVQTNRDAFVTDSCPARLLARLRSFAEGKVALEAAPQLSDPASRAALLARLDAEPLALIRALAYRPLDDRFCFSLAPFCHRPRPDLARVVSRSTLCLLSARKDRGQGAWNLFGVTRTSADGCYLSTRSSCRTRVFPSHDPAGAPNVATRLGEELSTCVGNLVTGEQLIAYCVGMLAAESFRRDHDAELHLDYPRIPRPLEAQMFEAHRAAGDAWIRAWLDPLSHLDADSDSESAPEATERKVHTISYDPARAELRWGDHILESLAPELWHFRIGDFAPFKQLSRTAVSLHDVSTLRQRVSACRDAAVLAERAYQLTRPVR